MTIASIDVRDLLGNPGAHRREALRGTLDDLGTEVAWVPSDEPIIGDVRLESIVEGVLVSGRLSGMFQMRCARCLKEFDAPFEVEVHELFVSEPADDTDDYPLEVEGSIEVEPMVRDAVGV